MKSLLFVLLTFGSISVFAQSFESKMGQFLKNKDELDQLGKHNDEAARLVSYIKLTVMRAHKLAVSDDKSNQQDAVELMKFVDTKIKELKNLNSKESNQLSDAGACEESAVIETDCEKKIEKLNSKIEESKNLISYLKITIQRANKLSASSEASDQEDADALIEFVHEKIEELKQQQAQINKDFEEVKPCLESEE